MNRDEIIKRIQPAIDALVDQLIALGPELVRGQLDAMLNGLQQTPTAKAKRNIKPAKSPKERTNTCRKCGAIGFTARTCGKTHNVESAPPTPRSRTASRASKSQPRPAMQADFDADEDRREENLSLSMLSAMRKAG